MTPLERLGVAADLYASVCEDRGRAMADLKRCIRECGEVGIPKLQIAQLAGVSRQTVYDTLQEGRP
jgi:predicted regulator of amino acid metabolism with ACT domain